MKGTRKQKASHRKENKTTLEWRMTKTYKRLSAMSVESLAT